MNKLEKEINLNKIIRKMYDRFGEENLSDIEKARYLYLEIGNLLRYDLNYNTAYDMKREDAYFKKVNYDDIKTNSYVCKQINSIYAELLNRAGIDAKVILPYDAFENDMMPHMYTKIDFKDGRKIIADLTFDLHNIQNGLETESFGTIPDEGLNLISKKELENIDRKIEYNVPINENESAYMNYFLKLLRQEIEDEEKLKQYLKNACSKIESNNYKSENLIGYKFDIICRCFFLDKMGYIEGNQFLKKVFENFFSKEEQEKIKIRILHYEKESERNIVNTEMITCYQWKRQEKSEYYLYEQGNSLCKVTRDELEQKIKSKKYNGWGKKKFVTTNSVDELFR